MQTFLVPLLITRFATTDIRVYTDKFTKFLKYLPSQWEIVVLLSSSSNEGLSEIAFNQSETRLQPNYYETILILIQSLPEWGRIYCARVNPQHG